MADIAPEQRMDSLTKAFLAECGGQMPRGIEINADSTRLQINLAEFIAHPAAKRYFEQMGKIVMTQRAMHSQMKIEIKDILLEKLALTSNDAQSLRRKAVSIPQITSTTRIPYTYMSVDARNNPVRLSSVMYRPSPFQTTYVSEMGANNFLILPGLAALLIDGVKGLWNAAFGYTIDYGVLSCHPTVTSTAEAPSGSMPTDEDVKMFCSDYALVVCPDYCGYGLSSYRQHPYLVQGVTARNVVDGYLAALDIAKDVKISGSDNWSLAEGFYTNIMGYSQGGSVALATLRYMESGQVSAEDLKRINLRHTYCGDGPYSPLATVNQYVEWANSSNPRYSNLAYPCVIPLIIQAAKDAYDNDCMRSVRLEDYFTPEFLATGILDALDSKSITTTMLNAKSAEAHTTTLDRIMSDKIIQRNAETGLIEINAQSNEYKCLARALGYNDLSQGWTPQHPVLFMHYDDDLVVPYCNLLAMKEAMAGATTPTAFITPHEALDLMKQDEGGLWQYAETLVKKTLENPDHVSVGTFFYMAAASGVLDKLLSGK
ncbi:MAG: hypothetical protein MJZ40_01320 [Bacteroidaceae bacterium]|nr:hypothetical protein [Bacteroidaceae bacterium]